MAHCGNAGAWAIVTLVLAACPALGQEATHDEFWPEVDAFVGLSDRARLLVIASLAKDREADVAEATVGVHVDFFVAPLFRSWLRRSPDVLKRRHLAFRVGYRYGWDRSEPREYEEHRVVLEATGRFPGPWHSLLADRSRVDLRDVDGVGSWRFRNRLRLERDVALGQGTVTPYAMAEVFYDSRHDAWTRQRYQLGVEWTFVGRSVLDTFYCRQDDSRSSVAHVNAAGLALSLYF